MSGQPHTGEVLGELQSELAPELELIRIIGEGSVAQVFLAREPALHRLVAVKVLRPPLASDDVACRRFEREARAAARVSHPNVTAVHRVGRLGDGRPYMVMEYVDGRSLEDLLAATGPPAVEEAIRILASIAAALGAAHRGGIIHRDVRPANVMIEAESGHVVLVDFGIAALLETGSEHVTRLTRAGMRLGDPQHMSPEQLRGEPVTPETDLWAWGVLGYELVTGRRPFGGSSVVEVLEAVLKADPPPVHELRPGVDPRLATLLRRCLDLEPRRRPRAAEALRELQRPRAEHEDGPAPAATSTVGTLPRPMRDFLVELKRRKVYRVAVAYAAGAFLVLQAADLVTPAFSTQSSEFWYRIILGVTLAGFPAALVLSWIFDVRMGAPSHREAALTRKRRVLPLVGLALSIAAAIAVWLLLW